MNTTTPTHERTAGAERAAASARDVSVRTRSIRYLEKGGLEIVEVEVPDPGPGEVQVKAAACGICRWDVSTYKVGSGDRWAAPPGHEGVGYVCKVGKGVTGFNEGDRVANGGFAGYGNFSQHSLHPIPPSTLPDEYWIVEPVSCIVNGLDTAHLMAGDRTAVIGCGFMGLLFIQALTRSFVEHVIAIDIEDAKLDVAKQLGATMAVNPSGGDIEDRLKELRALKIDKVFDCTGVQQGLDLSTKILRTGGLLSLVGWIRGEARFSGSEWHMGGFTVVNSSPLARIRDAFPTAIRMIDSGIFDLKPLVTDVVTLDGYAPLLDEVLKGRERPYIKGVVKLND